MQRIIKSHTESLCVSNEINEMKRNWVSISEGHSWTQVAARTEAWGNARTVTSYEVPRGRWKCTTVVYGCMETVVLFHRLGAVLVRLPEWDLITGFLSLKLNPKLSWKKPSGRMALAFWENSLYYLISLFCLVVLIPSVKVIKYASLFKVLASSNVCKIPLAISFFLFSLLVFCKSILSIWFWYRCKCSF